MSLAQSFQRHVQRFAACSWLPFRRASQSLSTTARRADAEKVAFPKNNYDWKVQPSEYQEDEDVPAGNLAATGPEPTYQKVASGFQIFKSPVPFACSIKDNPHSGVLPELQVAYETWGTLNSNASNAILLHTGLSASSHAASHAANAESGWWEAFIGPGKAIDTNKFFVVCCNVLGSCFGSTGPSSIDPRTGQEFSTSFPIITVEDMVRCQFLVLDTLGIGQLHASVGSSLGGMQSLTAAALFPDRVHSVVSISAAARSHPTSIALRYMQRRIIMADPHWRGGDYYGREFPYMGMKHAREIATISYRSGPEWSQRFARQRRPGARASLCPEFLIETYLDYQGTQACLRYDPNSLLYISKAMDLFDLSEGFVSLNEGLARIKCPSLIVGVQSDILFPVHQQRELAQGLRAASPHVTYYELDSLYGHDTFLLDLYGVGGAVKGFLERSLSLSPV